MKKQIAHILFYFPQIITYLLGRCNWTNASGHVDLFNGKEVEGHGYFNECGMAMLYKLK